MFEGNIAFRQPTLTDLTCSAEAGWVGRDAILMTGINAIIYLLATTPSWVLVDRWGRRVILLSGAVVVSISRCATWFLMFTVVQMAIALGATGYFMAIDIPITPRAVVGCVIIYNAFFGYRYS